MKKVYLKRLSQFDEQSVSSAAGELLAHLIDQTVFKLKSTVPIKVHFGEAGNKTFIPAACYDGIIDVLQSRGSDARYIETNVLYRGSRTTRDAHLEVAKDHGFTQIPVEIADGDHGEDNYKVTIDKTYFKTCQYGKAFEKYDQIVVCSHFKGHAMAGFGGAIKQLSMGFASRGGKMAQHARLVPEVSQSKCVACGLCVEACDVSAITIDEKAKIDESQCIGCAGCIAICPVAAIRNDWEADNFREKVTEYAYGAQLDKSFLYINFLMNITEKCDCVGQAMPAIAEDIGILVSDDPVALDMACYDVLNQAHGETLFSDGLTQIEHAKAIGFGDADYQLITL